MSNERWIFYALGLLFLLLLGMALVWGALNGQLPGVATPDASGAGAQTVLWTGIAPPIDLGAAERPARAAAQAWAADAVLIRAEATWRPTGEWTNTDSPPVSWTYIYFAASQGAVKSIAVRGEQLFDTPATAVPNQPQSLAAFPPTATVESAWLTFRAAGGEDFLKTNEGAAVHLQLLPTTEGDQWQVTAFRQQANMRVIIDAETGLLRNP